MLAVLTIQTAHRREVLEVAARAECQGPFTIQYPIGPAPTDTLGKVRVTITFQNPLDRDRFRRALADLPLIEADPIASPVPSGPGFLGRLFARQPQTYRP